MLGNFIYSNPTKIYFGKDSLENLKTEIKKYGTNILLIYGEGSIKKTGVYDKVIQILHEAGKNVYEDAGVMPNPTVEKLHEGVKRARACNADFLLAVGGGSVIDYAKAVSISVHCEEDPWDKYYIRFEEPTCRIIPVGAILTKVGTGSEMNGGAVITNMEQKLKLGHVFGENVYPKFSILNPEFTFTVSKYQMVAGIFDVMSHIMEQYFTGSDDCVSDYIMEGLMRSLIHSSKIAIKNPLDYEARSNIMWVSTWAINTLVSKGKTTDWMVQMIGQAIGAYTDATHGMTLSAISLPYYRYILDSGLHQFKRFAINVWHVSTKGKTDKEIALEGLASMEEWMKEIGLVLNITELGVTEPMLENIVKGTLLIEGGYKKLSSSDVLEILKASL